jgi:hypothetical protein
VSRPESFEVMRALMERQPAALAKAREAEAAGRLGKAVYWRTIAHEAAVLYAWLAGDDPRAAVARDEQRALNAAIETMDEQMARAGAAA